MLPLTKESISAAFLCIVLYVYEFKLLPAYALYLLLQILKWIMKVIPKLVVI